MHGAIFGEYGAWSMTFVEFLTKFAYKNVCGSVYRGAKFKNRFSISLVFSDKHSHENAS